MNDKRKRERAIDEVAATLRRRAEELIEHSAPSQDDTATVLLRLVVEERTLLLAVLPCGRFAELSNRERQVALLIGKGLERALVVLRGGTQAGWSGDLLTRIAAGDGFILRSPRLGPFEKLSVAAGDFDGDRRRDLSIGTAP